MPGVGETEQVVLERVIPTGLLVGQTEQQLVGQFPHAEEGAAITVSSSGGRCKMLRTYRGIRSSWAFEAI